MECYFDDSSGLRSMTDVDEDAGTSQISNEGTEVSFEDMILEHIQEHPAREHKEAELRQQELFLNLKTLKEKIEKKIRNPRC